MSLINSNRNLKNRLSGRTAMMKKNAAYERSAALPFFPCPVTSVPLAIQRRLRTSSSVRFTSHDDRDQWCPYDVPYQP